MQSDANEHFSHEDLDADLTDEDFKAMEANLSAMEDHLFNAGVAILQAAKTQEEIFTTSIDAIQEALEPGSTEAESPKKFLPSNSPTDVSLTAIWERLNTIEQRLEYLISHLVPLQVSSESTQSQITKNSEQSKLAGLQSTEVEWTEKSLKKTYKTLITVRSQLGIAAKNWKSAVNEANALRSL